MKLALSKGTLKAFRRLTIQFPNQYFINWIEVQCSLLIKKVWLSTELTFSFSEIQAGRWDVMFHLAFTHTHTNIQYILCTHTHTHTPGPPLIVSVFMGRFMTGEPLMISSVAGHHVTFPAATSEEEQT